MWSSGGLVSVWDQPGRRWMSAQAIYQWQTNAMGSKVNDQRRLASLFRARANWSYTLWADCASFLGLDVDERFSHQRALD